jgi:bifunctional DNA-binding transcriptional regulator/antitoxin component of YhaV-PrlF toxin-antitoxin module
LRVSGPREAERMVKVVVNNGQYKITIPKDIAEEKGWTSKTRLRFVEDAEGNIILKEISAAQEAKKRKR